MLKDSCLHYIWENFVSVSQEEEFGDLPKEMLCSDDLLGSENLKVDSEYQVNTLFDSFDMNSNDWNTLKLMLTLNWLEFYFLKSCIVLN